MPISVEQITNTLLMVRPARFGYNPQTADSNAFQQPNEVLSDKEVALRAVDEFDGLVHTLREAGITVVVVEDTVEPHKPDAVFPNNWVSFHQDGTIVTYPMLATQRRQECRADVLLTLRERYGFTRRIALEEQETKGRFLEGTGSLVLDRVHRIAYACHSNRTHPEVLSAFAQKMNFRIVLFNAVDMEGQAIYHTNVMMALGTTFVVICLDTIRSTDERSALEAELAQTNKAVIPISLEQMVAFAGNMLQVVNDRGDTYLIMSEQAYRSLQPDQIDQIEQHTGILFSPLKTIETYGGGSARCMLAEIFYPGMLTIK